MPLLVVVTSASAFTREGSTLAQQQRRDTALMLYRSAAEAIYEAEEICALEGPDSERCKVAWDIVEELESADSHTRTISAQDEISYQPMISSLDILSEKINRKLDELQKLASSMAECGAGAEVERLVYASEEMKGIIRDATQAVEQYREY